jgi:hypothetical protein
MTNPTPEQVEASIEALYTDAGTWAIMAGQLEQMSQVARGLTLGTFDFSGLAHLTGMDQTYSQLQERVTSLLQQGSATFDNISGALRTSADGYARDEESALHRMKKIY